MIAIYKIEFDVDNYRSLLAADEVCAMSGKLAFDGSSRDSGWICLDVIQDNINAPEPDIFDLGAGNLVLKGRSLELLKPKLSDYCEFLPVRWGRSHGEAVNLVGLSDCLDAEATKWVIGKESGKRIRIEKYEFFGNKVPRRLIFKIPERPYELFCTDIFKNMIEINGILGLEFEAVWDSSTFE